ncbi:MAG: hypothetical protein M1836_006007 [Candelina mexicana]|nr:MAG: hypothetical protein M1836_006007 [Candelina mexicana]
MIKAAGSGVTWRAISFVHTHNTITVTGTSAINDIKDVAGILGLIQTEAIWNSLNVSATSDPFLFDDDDERSILRCTERAVTDFVTPMNMSEQGKRMAKVYIACLMKRTYTTRLSTGNAIGADIPSLKTRTIFMQTSGAYQAEFSNVTGKYLEKLLFRRVDQAGISRILWRMGPYRVLVTITLWFKFQHVAHWDGTKRIDDIRKQFSLKGPQGLGLWAERYQ